MPALRNETARDLQAQTFEQLAYGSENGTWRNVYLAGAYELRNGVFGSPTSIEGLAAGLSVEDVFAGIAVRIDGPSCWDEHIVLSWVFTDLDEAHITELRNGVLVRRSAPAPAHGSTTLTLTRPLLLGLMSGAVDLATALQDGTIAMTGDIADLQSVLAAIGPVDEAFPIVTPRKPL